MIDAHRELPAPADIPPAADGRLLELLAAFQFLQAQNIRMTNALSARFGLGPTDLRLLLYVHRAPDATPTEVALQLEQTSGSITALIDRLVRSGHVVRRPHPSDRRSITLRLTESGVDVVHAVRGAYRDAFSGVFPDGEIGRAADTLRLLGGSLSGATAGV